jgi:hypothetical protein
MSHFEIKIHFMCSPFILRLTVPTNTKTFISEISNLKSEYINNVTGCRYFLVENEGQG